MEGAAKDKARELERIRQNQQRSRKRKRAYIAELEANVRRLEKDLDQRQSCRHTTGSPEIAEVEMEARRELLKVLGINEAAQEQYVQAFAKRTAAQTLSEFATAKVEQPRSAGRTTGSEDAAENTFSKRPTKTDLALDLLSPSVSDSSHLEISPNIAAGSPMLSGSNNSWQTAKFIDSRNYQVPLLVPTTPLDTFRPAQRLDGQTLPPSLCGPCLQNGNPLVPTPISESMTGCSIAFSMLMSNNARGYTLSELDARLHAAYRTDDTVSEGCSVLSKTLFQVLGEIS